MRSQKISYNSNSKFSQIDKENFKFVKFPNFKSVSKYFFYKNIAKKIIENEVKNHTILIARLPSASGTIAVKAARKYNKPYLVEFVACTFDTYWNYNWKGKLIALYKMKQQQALLEGCSHVIYVTENYLQKKYPTFGKSINCSNVELTKHSVEVLLKRIEKITLSGKILKIGTIAGLDIPYKGQADVIKTLAILKNVGLEFNYQLIGQGSPNKLLKNALKHGVISQVEVLGEIQHKDIFRAIDEMDILIHPSYTEGLPRVVIEAMSRGCPVIATRVGGLPDILDKDAIYPAGAIKPLTDKLASINKEWLLRQANYNFEKSKQYAKSYLDNKRSSFYSEFLTDYRLKRVIE